MTTLFGINNCDTVRKARAWLEAHGIEYSFHDYKISSIERERLEKWIEVLGWEALLNRAGTTFRKLPDVAKTSLTAEKAICLMLAQPSMIKRPELEHDGHLSAGFKPELYEREFRESV